MTPAENRRKWAVFAAVAMGVFLVTIDGSIVNVALPTLQRSLATNFATIQWIVLAYLLTVTTLMLSMGRLGDMLGKKPLYTAGLVIFTLGSVLSGLASSVYQLIAFRVVQAVGASMMMALGTAIITEAFPANERGKALGLSGLVVSLGIIAGPTLGGLVLQALSWHWIFFVNLPVGMIGLFMVLRFVPANLPAGGQTFDLPGAALLLAALGGLLLGMTIGQEAGFTSPVVMGLFSAFAVFLAVFMLVERRASHPMIDLDLFRNSLFSVNLITGLMVFVSASGTILLMPFYLENVLGYEPQRMGLLLSALPVLLGVTAPVAGALSDRYGSRLLAMVGLAVLAAGYLAISTLSVDTTALGYMLRFAPIGIGMGLFLSPNNSAVMGTAPKQRLGVASGLLALTRTLGQTTGIAVLGAVWASRAAFHAGGLIPGGVTEASAAVQVAALNDTSLIIVGVISIALALSVWAWVTERRRKSTQAVLAGGPVRPGSRTK